MNEEKSELIIVKKSITIPTNRNKTKIFGQDMDENTSIFLGTVLYKPI